MQDGGSEVMRRCVWEPTKIEALSGVAIKQVSPRCHVMLIQKDNAGSKQTLFLWVDTRKE